MKQVTIGYQVWMTENLNVDKFQNGDLILEAKTEKDWEEANKNEQAAWCYYENEPANGPKYGKLYNWFAVNDPRGLAPKGWHISEDEEWNIMESFILGNDGEIEDCPEIGNLIKSSEFWEENVDVTNETNFSALPSGKIDLNGTFENEGCESYFWTASEDGDGGGQMLAGNNDYARYRKLDEFEFLGKGKIIKKSGLSVRCIKNS